jgi:hypothetical protein
MNSSWVKVISSKRQVGTRLMRLNKLLLNNKTFNKITRIIEKILN